MSTISKKSRKKKVDLLITEMAEAIYELNKEQFINSNSRSGWKVGNVEGSSDGDLTVEVTIPVINKRKCIELIKVSIRKNLFEKPITPSMGEPDISVTFVAEVKDGN